MGLLDKAQQSQQQSSASAHQPSNAQEPPQQRQPQQSPQQQGNTDQQEVYERIASMALNYVYSEQGANMVLEGLRLKNGDITQNAGNIVAKIITRLIISARTAGGSIPPKVMLQVGMETAVAVLELAEADNGLPNAEPGMLDAVFYAAVTMVGKELPEDMLSTQERQEIRQTLEEVSTMQGAEQVSQGDNVQQGRVQAQQPQQAQQIARQEMIQ